MASAKLPDGSGKPGCEINSKDKWELREVLDFWNNPKNRKLIVNAVPIYGNHPKFMDKISEQDMTFPVKESLSESTVQPVLNRLIRPNSLPGKSTDDFQPTKSTNTAGVLIPATADRCCCPTSGFDESAHGKIREVALPTDGHNSDALINFERQSTHGEEISESDLHEFPYNNVGKVFWVFPNDPTRDPPVFCSTGFYIGRNTVITVAHNFERSNNRSNDILAERTPVFVPAMVDKHDIKGKNYGIFILDYVFVHSQYSPTQNFYRYDICIAKIIKGTESTKPLTDRHLQLTEFVLPESQSVSVIGYKFATGKMIKYLGTTSNEGTPTSSITIFPAAFSGMSGGPWIDNAEIVVGIQSSTLFCYRDERPPISASPILTRAVLDSIDKVILFYEKINCPQEHFEYTYTAPVDKIQLN